MFKPDHLTHAAMPNIEVSLPDRIDTEIDQLVQEDEFLNRDQAIEELLSMGVSAYNATASSTTEDEWGIHSDHQDPALQDGLEDDGPMF